MTTRPLHIITYEGNLLYYPVTIRRYGSKLAQNLSAATSITIEWENDEGVAQQAINVLDNLPGADWANGIVALPILPSNFTAAIGRYTFSLTIVLAGQTITYNSGVVEVQERPGWPPAP